MSHKSKFIGKIKTGMQLFNSLVGGYKCYQIKMLIVQEDTET